MATPSYVALSGADPEAVRRRTRAAAWTGAVVVLLPPDAPRLGLVVDAGRRPGVTTSMHADGTIVVVDGEVFAEEGSAPLDAAGEVLAAVRSGGIGALASLHLEATVVVVDPDGTLHLARDPFGAVHLYWWAAPDATVWSDHLPTLVLHGAPPDVDLLAVDCLLTQGRIPAPWTMLSAVRKVGPADEVVIGHGRPPETRRYWVPNTEPKWQLESGDITGQLRDLLAASLERRWTPGTAALLSAGVDSSLLVAGVRRLLGHEIDTYTFRYLDYEGEFNEDAGARRLADAVGARHHVLEIGPADLSGMFDELTGIVGEPFTWGVHSFGMRAVAGTGASALLQGAGPDSWYGYARRAPWVDRYRSLPWGLQQAVESGVELAGRVSFRRTGWIREVAHHAMYGARPRIAGVQEREALHRENGLARVGRDAQRLLARNAESALPHLSLVDRSRYVEWQTFEVEAVRFCNARWSRAFGLPVRYPFLDRDLHAFAMRLDRPGDDKEHVRALATELMPIERAAAPKLSQTIPIEEWFRGPLEAWLRDQLSPERLSAGRVLDPALVQARIDDHVAGRRNNMWLLWSVISLTAWQLDVLHPAAAAAPRSAPV